jgi:SAM-dependent methyltransferase
MSKDQISASYLTDLNQDELNQWFREHYEDAPRQIVNFFDDERLSFRGARVADIGCGDGIIDLGLMHIAAPDYLAGFDVKRTDEAALLEVARAAGVCDELPEGLEFFECEDRHIPAEDHSFDRVVSWSTFEHVKDPTAVVREIRRILRPTGVFFLQLYPFFRSAHGSHLWTWFPEGFAQLRLTREEIEARVLEEPDRSSAAWAHERVEDLRTLNEITLDGLQDALYQGGLTVTKVELLTSPLHLPLDLQQYRIADFAISGIKLVAVPL